MTTENSTKPDDKADIDNTLDNNEVANEQVDKQTEQVDNQSDDLTDGSLAALEKTLEDAKSKAEENWALYLSAKAEADNIRKRASRDVENAHKYALDKFVPELLAVKDSLEMGLKAAKDSNEIEKFIEGNNLTLKLFDDTLAKFNVSEVNPVGETFNPDLHQAMTMIASPEHPANTVIDVIQKGYTLNERLVRPALVVVSQGK